MLIEISKKPNLYDDIYNSIYHDKNHFLLINNFIPVKFDNNHYIMSSSKDVESFLLEYRKNIDINLYYNNKRSYTKLKKIISFQEINYDFEKTDYDCYIDSHLDLLFIKYYDNELDYYNINFNSIDEILNINLLNINFNLKWIDYNLNSNCVNLNKNIEYKWLDNYFVNLPAIPIFTINSKDLIVTTGGIITTNDNILLGMVNFTNEDKIYITPILSIYRSLRYLKGDNLLSIYINHLPIYFEFDNVVNKKFNKKYGIMIANNYYNKLYNNIKKNNTSKTNNNEDNNEDNILLNNKKEANNLIKYSIICSIDNYYINSEENLIISENLTIPIKSYIWLFKNINKNNIEFEIIKNTHYNIDKSEFYYQFIKISDNNLNKNFVINKCSYNIKNNFNICSSLNISDIKYINYKNNYIIELNEKILLILKNIIIKHNIYDNIGQKIINNSFNNNNYNNKILIKLNLFSNKLPNITIINKFKNFDTLYNNFTNRNELIEFIKNI